MLLYIQESKQKSTEALEAVYYIRNECLREGWDIANRTVFKSTQDTPHTETDKCATDRDVEASEALTKPEPLNVMLPCVYA